MSFDVRISKQADRDLRDIFEYIAYDLLSPENAVGQLERLEDAISKLDNMPEKYRRYDREPWKSRGLRVFPVDNYLVFYVPNMDIQVVTVIRVMYGGRDVNRQLKEFTKFEQ